MFNVSAAVNRFIFTTMCLELSEHYCIVLRLPCKLELVTDDTFSPIDLSKTFHEEYRDICILKKPIKMVPF